MNDCRLEREIKRCRITIWISHKRNIIRHRGGRHEEARYNDNDVLHGVFDNDVDPSSLASILPILIHKIKRGRIWNLCDHCSHVCSILLLFPSVCSILSSILLPFFNAISFLFLLQRRKGNMQSITIYKGNTKVWYGLFFFLLPISPLK